MIYITVLYIYRWACGVIMYTLLAGFPPFWHRKQLVMLRAIMNGKYEFVSPEWDEISDSAKDMVIISYIIVFIFMTC